MSHYNLINSIERHMNFHQKWKKKDVFRSLHTATNSILDRDNNKAFYSTSSTAYRQHTAHRISRIYQYAIQCIYNTLHTYYIYWDQEIMKVICFVFSKEKKKFLHFVCDIFSLSLHVFSSFGCFFFFTRYGIGFSVRFRFISCHKIEVLSHIWVQQNRELEQHWSSLKMGARITNEQHIGICAHINNDEAGKTERTHTHTTYINKGKRKR